MRTHAPIVLLLVAGTFAVFFQVREHGLVDCDDRLYILENPNLADGLRFQGGQRSSGTLFERAKAVSQLHA